MAVWMVKLIPSKVNGLSKDSAADCFQVRSLSEDRFVKKIGQVNFNTLEDLKEALKKVLSIY